MNYFFAIISAIALMIGCHKEKAAVKGFAFADKKQEKKVDLLYNGKLITAYCYFDSISKPILFPVNTLTGVPVTRGYPIAPREGESSDHPHHTGVWMNYESVNDLDFWNNSTAIPDSIKNRYGTIHHRSVDAMQAHGDTAVITASATWDTPNGETLLDEKTGYHFFVKDSQLVIDRVTMLTAKKQVRFKDVKDGFFAIRVSKHLEMHTDRPEVKVGAMCSQDEVERLSYEGFTALYENSNGVQGDSVWSSQGSWVILRGVIYNRNVSVAILDHPDNPGYTAYWHARGYGLFAVNPLGRKVFSGGRDSMNLVLQPGDSIKFQYRLLVVAGKPVTHESMDSIAHAFSQVHYQQTVK